MIPCRAVRAQLRDSVGQTTDSIFICFRRLPPWLWKPFLNLGLSWPISSLTLSEHVEIIILFTRRCPRTSTQRVWNETCTPSQSAEWSRNIWVTWNRVFLSFFFSSLSLSHRRAARCSDVSVLKLEQKLGATANVFQQSSAALRLTEGLSGYYHSQRWAWDWHISITPSFYRTVCSVAVVNMSDSIHTVTDLRGCSAQSSDPSLFLVFFFQCFCFQTVAFQKSVQGCLHGRFVACNSACFGMNPMAFGSRGGGVGGGGDDGKALNPAVSLYSGLFSTFLSLPPPTPSLLYFWKHLILVSQARHARRAPFASHPPPHWGEEGFW